MVIVRAAVAPADVRAPFAPRPRRRSEAGPRIVKMIQRVRLLLEGIRRAADLLIKLPDALLSKPRFSKHDRARESREPHIKIFRGFSKILVCTHATWKKKKQSGQIGIAHVQINIAETFFVCPFALGARRKTQTFERQKKAGETHDPRIALQCDAFCSPKLSEC